MLSKRSRESISTEEAEYPVSAISPTPPTIARQNSPSLVTTRTLSTMITPSPATTETTETEDESSSSSLPALVAPLSPTLGELSESQESSSSSSSSSSSLASRYPPKRFVNTFEPTVFERDIFRRCMSMISRTTCYDWQFDAHENGIHIVKLSEEFEGCCLSVEVELQSSTSMVGRINCVDLTNDRCTHLQFVADDTQGTLCLTRIETSTSFLVFTRTTFLTFTTYIPYGADSNPWNYRPALGHLDFLSI